MIISITDRALGKIRLTASAAGVDLTDTLLRIAVVPGGCSGLTYDLGWDTVVRKTDETLEIEGVRIVMDLKSRLYIDGSELDFSDGLDGKGYHFVNPNAVRTCA
ncbi:MAG: iron-sulfur cluster assembly accessory protein [Bacteroidetes bacterium]|nr:iron-sulfur cluster assembly accessory protein [Bacteroidota bacterium]